MKTAKKPKPAKKPDRTRLRDGIAGAFMPVYDSMEQASGATGIPLALLRNSKKEGCLFIKHGRVHIGEWIRWFFTRTMEKESDWPTRDKAATALIKETKLEILRRSVVEFEYVERFIRHVVGQVFFGEIERIRAEFPVMLKGRGEVEIAKLVGTRLDKLADDCRASIETWEKETKTKHGKEDDEWTTKKNSKKQ